jgi:uncharacterized protein (TIGR02246 family)
MMRERLHVRFFVCRNIRIGILISFFLIALTVEAATTEEGRRIKSDDREALSQTVGGLVSAWNQNDAESISKLFLADAELIMPNGKVARSRGDIRQKLLDEWRGKLKDTTLSHVVEDVAIVSTSAVVKGKYRLNGVKVLGIEKTPQGSFIIQHKKHQGRWMISRAELLRDDAGG